MLTTDWNYYDFNHVVFSPRNMSPQELQEGTDKVIHDFYSYKSTAAGEGLYWLKESDVSRPA